MIISIQYFDYEETSILVTYENGPRLYNANYRDEEINTWLETHSIEEYIDPEDYNVTMRSERNRLLTECDWTQLPDVPLTQEQKEAWATYRQELRDFPDEHDVHNREEYEALVWPTPPA